MSEHPVFLRRAEGGGLAGAAGTHALRAPGYCIGILRGLS
jgi:hypothetical protein